MASRDVLRVIAVVAIALACGEEAPPQAAAAPLPTDWHECVRQGAVRRARCPRHFQVCGDRAAAMGIDCYQAVWKAQRTAADRSRLGPRWAYDLIKDGDSGTLDPLSYAKQVCRTDLANSPRQACEDEVMFALDVPFASGFTGDVDSTLSQPPPRTWGRSSP